MRAYNEDDTIFKIEPKNNELYMVTAVPVYIQERKLVVELIKVATNSVYLESGKLGDKIKILSTFEYINQAAVKDDLTDLYNRRYINEKLPVDLLNSSMKNEPLSIIFADLDFFKVVNDTYGHPVGDQVLQEFSDVLKKYIRNEKDWVARYGGEEF
jgi:PleD family two-component response regulator